MTVTLADAKEELNLEDFNDDLELQLYVDAANQWVGTKVPVSQIDDPLARLATLFLIDHWWQTQRGPASSPVSGDELVTIGGRGYAIPNRVKELLEPYTASSVGRPKSGFPLAGGWPDPANPFPPYIEVGRR